MELDALVIGAGVAGLYQLHQLREQGLRVRAYDTADDLGGTWWWHAYPGARVDTEGYLYQYLFSRELYDEWSWSERFPAGYEVLRWLRFLADRLDVRRDIQFSTRIARAVFDEDRGRWTVRTDGGETIDTRFVISCAGAPGGPVDLEGQDTFEGPVLHTARWPRKGPDLAGARVGVVGVDATGVQLIPKIVDQVGHLTAFVDSPQYVVPMRNPMYGWQDRAAYKARFPEFADTLPHSAGGFDASGPASLEELYADGSLRLWRAGVDGASDFVRDRMRARLGDPHLHDVLLPGEDVFGARREALDNGYLEVFARDDVTLVGDPIRRARPDGIELADGTVHALDVIVLAVSTDAGAGALARIDVRGRDGRSLAEEWDTEVRTTLGLGVHGYPNLLLAGGPLAPSAALCNTTPLLQGQTEWIAAAVRDTSTIEPTADGEDAWVSHHRASGPVDPLSWQPGLGSPGRALTYGGGLDAYLRACAEEAAAGYPSFTRT